MATQIASDWTKGTHCGYEAYYQSRIDADGKTLGDVIVYRSVRENKWVRIYLPVGKDVPETHSIWSSLQAAMDA